MVVFANVWSRVRLGGALDDLAPRLVSPWLLPRYVATMVEERGFPFVGAGDASYFEWAEMFVAFEKPPAKAVAAAIVKRVPPPLRDTIEWNGRVLWVASEQGVGRTIAAAYGKQKQKATKLTTRSQFKVAPSSAYGRFNADIDAWLEFANEKSPILVAMRAEDEGAGGTVLSAWHHASVAAIPKVLAQLARDDDGSAAELGVRLVELAKAAGVKVSASIAKTLARRAAHAEEEEADESPDWDALAAAAKKALGAPAPRYTKLRSADDLEPSLVRLAKVLPLTAKRLRNPAITLPRGKSSPACVLVGKPGWGGGIPARESKNLDTLLDLVFKRGGIDS